MASRAPPASSDALPTASSTLRPLSRAEKPSKGCTFSWKSVVAIIVLVAAILACCIAHFQYQAGYLSHFCIGCYVVGTVAVLTLLFLQCFGSKSKALPALIEDSSKPPKSPSTATSLQEYEKAVFETEKETTKEAYVHRDEDIERELNGMALFIAGKKKSVDEVKTLLNEERNRGVYELSHSGLLGSAYSRLSLKYNNRSLDIHVFPLTKHSTPNLYLNYLTDEAGNIERIEIGTIFVSRDTSAKKDICYFAVKTELDIKTRQLTTTYGRPFPPSELEAFKKKWPLEM